MSRGESLRINGKGKRHRKKASTGKGMRGFIGEAGRKVLRGEEIGSHQRRPGGYPVAFWQGAVIC